MSNARCRIKVALDVNKRSRDVIFLLGPIMHPLYVPQGFTLHYYRFSPHLTGSLMASNQCLERGTPGRAAWCCMVSGRIMVPNHLPYPLCMKTSHAFSLSDRQQLSSITQLSLNRYSSLILNIMIVS